MDEEKFEKQKKEEEFKLNLNLVNVQDNREAINMEHKFLNLKVKKMS